MFVERLRLQSADELMRAAAALGLEPKTLELEPKRLREIFNVRNKIIHELDIDLAGQRRKRVVRARDPMLEHARELLASGERLIDAVRSKVAAER